MKGDRFGVWRRSGEPSGPQTIYIDHVIEALAELASKEKQERLWSGGETLRSDLGEAVEQLYDDSGLSSVLNGPDAARLLGERLVAAFESLLAATQTVDSSEPDHIESSEMALVRTAAARTLDLVHDHASTSPSE